MERTVNQTGDKLKVECNIVFQNLENIIKKFFNISNIVNGLTIITSIITILGILHAWRNSKLKIYTQYILNNIFIDRKSVLCEVSNAIKDKNIAINIYGKRGVGKSNFLRFYCDLNNHKLKKKDKKILKKQFAKKAEFRSLCLYRTKTFYLEISGYQTRSDLNSQISESVTGKSGFSNIEVAEKLRKTLLFHKRIVIIIDNVNTSGLEKEIENIIKIFYAVSSKFCFIIGSIRELSFLDLLDTKQKYIELQNFEENDIREFIRYNYPVVDCNLLADILKISEGLPILVNLYLKGVSKSGFINNVQIKKYVQQITENLSPQNLILAQCIALLSITNPSIPVELLRLIISDFNNNDILNLVNNALIEYNPINHKIKMHEIFRDFINSFYVIDEQDYILRIYRYFKENSTEYESAYYAFLVEDINTKNLVIPTVEKAIAAENYSFLLLFGEHIKSIFGFQSRIGSISKEAFYTVLLGYLEGLIGVGDYPAAKEIIEKSGVAVRECKTLVQLKLSLLIANLYHLQNQYIEAIALYEIILNEINNTNYGNAFIKYEAKCLLGIAHSYRHEGLKYTLAELYYREAIESAKNTNQRSIILKCHFELVTIYILQNNFDAINNEFSLIDKIFVNLPEKQYIYTRIAYKKVRARYIRFFGIRTLEDDLALLKSALKEYEIQKKRLQYNTFFDIGEYYRHNNQYIKAVENYRIAYNFSIKNNDINLSTMSRLGMILCDNSQNPNNITDILSNILNDCIENHLHTNKIFARLILDIVQDNKLSQETQNNLKLIGINLKDDESYMNADNIHLILM